MTSDPPPTGSDPAAATARAAMRGLTGSWVPVALTSLAIGLSLALWLAAARSLPPLPPSRPAAIDLEGARLRVLAGKAEPVAEGTRVTLDRSGEAALAADVSAFAADYPFLQLDAGRLPIGMTAGLYWRGARRPSPLFQRPAPATDVAGGLEIPYQQWTTLVLPLAGLAHWRDEIRTLAIRFAGEPGETLVFQRMRLLPASMVALARAYSTEWLGYLPWDQTSINFRRGTGAGLLDVPPVVAALVVLALSLMALLVLTALGPRPRRLDWRAVGMLGLVTWLALDLSWQWRLWQQLEDTRQQFAGHGGEERMRRAPDGALYGFIERVRPLISGEGARVFVVASPEYFGMRAAYHLLPINAIWRRGGPALPPASGLRPGDYVLTYGTDQLSYDPAGGVLLWIQPSDAAATVEQRGVTPLLQLPGAGLFRVR